MKENNFKKNLLGTLFCMNVKARLVKMTKLIQKLPKYESEEE